MLESKCKLVRGFIIKFPQQDSMFYVPLMSIVQMAQVLKLNTLNKHATPNMINKNQVPGKTRVIPEQA